MSEENYKGLTISLKGHYRMINNEKKGIISEFVKKIEDIMYEIYDEDALTLLGVLLREYEEKLK